MTQAIYDGITTYSSRHALVQLVGYRDGAGQKLVSQPFAQRLEERLIGDMLSTHSSNPANEWALLRCYWLAAESLGESFTPVGFEQPDEIRSLFHSARSVARAQSMDSRVVRQEERLFWDGLVRVLGSEQAIHDANTILRGVDGESSLVGLVDLYLSGWRPKEF
ncbi:hypothetical protein ACRAWB_17055 [Leifsonia poae]|uniref:hypothetical protein n=1 Tax=Leifsonia poae TaxID=110933 RepID=UPI003D6996A2